MWMTIFLIAVAAILLPWFAVATGKITDRRLAFGTAAVTALLAAQIVFVAYDLGVRKPPPDWGAAWIVANFGFAVQIGLLVGATELISRYRDEPFAPLLSVAGIFYILFNGAAS